MKDKITFIKNNLKMFQPFNTNYKVLSERLQRNINYLEKQNKKIKIQAQSEIDYIRAKSAEEIHKNTKYAQEELLREVIYILDNLESFIRSTKDINDPLFLSHIQGIKLTLKYLRKLLMKFGLGIIEQTKVKFDPYMHQAIALIESTDVMPEHIVEVLHKGYSINGKLIRPAVVTISKKDEFNLIKKK